MPELIQKINTKQNNEVRLFCAEPHYFEKTLLIIGVMHGDEWQGEPLVERLMLDEPTTNKILYIPCLNPDGKAKNTRQNANRVDLNRNFPTQNWRISWNPHYWGGWSAASEIETKFLMDIIDKHKPDAVLTLHNPYRIVNYDGPAEEIAREMSNLTSYPLQQDIGYPTPGSFGTYCGVERNIPTITLELPDESNLDKLWEENQKAFEYFTQI